MPRLLLVVLVVVAVVVGGLFALSGKAHEKPLKQVEKAVPLANLQK